MISFLRSIFALTLILIIGLVTIIGLTYRNTNRFTYLFTRPNGTICETPCLFGADPIAMTIEQVDQVFSVSVTLKQATIQRNGKTHTVYYTTDGLAVAVFPSSFQNDSIELSVKFSPKDRPTLGALLVLLGAPERMPLNETALPLPNVSKYCSSVIFYIQGRVIEFEYIGQEEQHCITGWDWEISRIRVYAAHPELLEMSVPWQGFKANNYSYYTFLRGDGD